jgi:hypothetical protein
MSIQNSSNNPDPPLSFLQAQLLRDLEAYSGYSCKAICDLRPELYGELNSLLRRSTQNKYSYLKGLKKTRPDRYWKLYSRASAVCPKDQEVANEEEESLWSSPEPEAEEPAAALSRHSSWRSQTPSFGNQEESPLSSVMRDSSFLAMSVRSPSSRKSQVTRESPGQARTMYATLEEAEDGSKLFLVVHYCISACRQRLSHM